MRVCGDGGGGVCVCVGQKGNNNHITNAIKMVKAHIISEVGSEIVWPQQGATLVTGYFLLINIYRFSDFLSLCCNKLYEILWRVREWMMKIDVR